MSPAAGESVHRKGAMVRTIARRYLHRARKLAFLLPPRHVHRGLPRLVPDPLALLATLTLLLTVPPSAVGAGAGEIRVGLAEGVGAGGIGGGPRRVQGVHRR